MPQLPVPGWDSTACWHPVVDGDLGATKGTNPPKTTPPSSHSSSMLGSENAALSGCSGPLAAGGPKPHGIRLGAGAVLSEQEVQCWGLACGHPRSTAQPWGMRPDDEEGISLGMHQQPLTRSHVHSREQEGCCSQVSFPEDASCLLPRDKPRAARGWDGCWEFQCPPVNAGVVLSQTWPCSAQEKQHSNAADHRILACK